jgi:RNA recognition motif-containing protein
VVDKELLVKLHIGNLPKTVTEPELKDLVVAISEATSVELVKDSGGASKGFGFAEFATDDQGKAVIAGLDGKDVGGQTLKVSEARPRKGDAQPTAARV